MKSIEVDLDAWAEIHEAVAWYERREDGVGARFANDVARTLEQLPHRALTSLRGFESLGVSFVHVVGPWPYRLLVIDEPTALWVFALVHDRREPGYWKSRLASR